MTIRRQWRDAFECISPTREQVDLAHPEAAMKQLSRYEFDTLINCAAMARPDDCEDEPALAFRINAESPILMASLAASRGARLVQISTDFVFSGDNPEPLTEEAPANPISVYGESKRAAEIGVLEANPEALVGRVSWLFGPHKSSHPDHVLKQARTERTLSAISDKWSIPTANVDLASWLRALLGQPNPPKGILHLVPCGKASWYDWTVATLEMARSAGLPLKTEHVEEISLDSFGHFRAKRPQHSALSNEKLRRLMEGEISDWRESLERYVRCLCG